VAGEIDAVCVVDDAIEDGVSIGGIADQLVPFVDGECACQSLSLLLAQQPTKTGGNGRTSSSPHQGGIAPGNMNSTGATAMRDRDGRWSSSAKPAMQTFLDAIPMTKEKMIAA
jgi:hypothetical protein